MESVPYGVKSGMVCRCFKRCVAWMPATLLMPLINTWGLSVSVRMKKIEG